MSWVKITNGVITTKVPKQSFVDLYQKNGFTVVVENNPTLAKSATKITQGVEPNDKPRASTSARSESKSATKLPVATKRRD